MIDQQLGDDPRHELAGIVPFAPFEAQRERRRWQEMCGRRLRFRRRGATLRRMRPYPSQPVTLAELRQCACRVWLYCDSCGRGAPATVAPRIIRLGPAASSGVVRRGARCTLCGGRTGHHRAVPRARSGDHRRRCGAARAVCHVVGAPRNVPAGISVGAPHGAR